MIVAYFLTDAAYIDLYTLSLHDALPISLNATPARQIERAAHPQAERKEVASLSGVSRNELDGADVEIRRRHGSVGRSEEHTSELQSQSNLVCRLLLEQKHL